MNTNRILATLGVVLVLLTAGVVVAIRVFAAPAQEDGGPVVELELDVERFAGIELHGLRELQFTPADEYSAVLTGERSGFGSTDVDSAEVSTDADRLSIPSLGHAPSILGASRPFRP